MNWEYCECGCHGHEASAGSVHFWLFNDLKGNLFLHRGHGWMSPLIAKYKDSEWKLADAQANLIVKEEIDNMKKALKKPKK